MNNKKIIIKGAKEHNLKNIDLEIPRDKLVVITGLSGSGKSSLAFDTIYAEGQRRYVESLSAYARQFLEQMEKPDVEYIEGLSPAISIEQKTVSKNPRSTVGTVTEIYDYLRLLYARIGKVYCHKCGREIASQTVQQIVDRVRSLPERSKVQILSPIVRDRKGEYKKDFENMQRQGFVRVRVDGKMRELTEKIELDKNKKHTIEIVVDRIIIKEGIERRLADSIELALKMADGIAIVTVDDKPVPEGINRGEELLFSEKFACLYCNISYPDLAPRMFSFNSPHGACPECDGLGTDMHIDADMVIPDKSLSLRDGAIKPWERKTSVYFYQMLQCLSEHYGFSLDAPFKDLDKKIQDVILDGSKDEQIKFFYERDNRRHFYHTVFEGVIANLERRYKETDSEYMREEIQEYMSMTPCPACKGLRLKPESLSVKIAGKTIMDVTAFSVKDAIGFFNSLSLTEQEYTIARRILKEIKERLGFMKDVGLDYLTLDRTSATLSGGEGQRIRLATQIGSSLVGVLYILDEPSIGLHQKDNKRLLDTLIRLRNLGNTVIVVEHDRDTILTADYVIDLGPGAGVNGGSVIACGSPEDILSNKKSLTGRYLSGDLSIPVPKKRRNGSSMYLQIFGASQNNLKNIDVSIPLGLFTCVTGVSGSGKSTLIIDILYRSLAKFFWKSTEKAGKFSKLKGIEFIDKVIDIDQSPIGRTPRSNPATYTGLFNLIRDLFAQLPESRKRGYKAGRFSFNVKGGRCEACAGDGIIKIEMHFLPDIYVTCEVCRGKRFNRETLDIQYKGKNIADVLDMTVNEALSFFENIPAIKSKLDTISDVGLDYIKLGQSATTLSGGEAQRVKLSKELSKRSTGRTLYILDEPTTGLHFADIQKLLDVLNRLTDAGNTVVVIEHNLDVLKTADYIIDLGPEGGDAGGEIVATGTPEDVSKNPKSYTGQFLKTVLH
ncbi:MAG: excinuclease ABC subunit UvrA [Nitrospinae bacterium]|nr:excinuclease ABC subunit UvrA [Nitrospinota bacterium]MBI3812886.1 excinuclease ABC subunit UvrA [Nitrospinota bacterium]